MGKKQRLFPKASMVHTPSKDFRKKSKSMVLTCPTHRITSPWELDHFPKSETAAVNQPISTQIPLRYSSKTTPPPLTWQKRQTTSTGPLPSLKYQGKIRSLLPKKYHSHNFGLTIPTSDFRTKTSVDYPTSSKQFVLPPLVSVHQSKSSVKLKHNLRATSGVNSVPKISPGRSHQSKQKLKRKGSKTMKEPLAQPRSHSITSSAPVNQNHAAVHNQTCSRRRKIAAALLGGLDLWPKDIIIKLPSPEAHCNTKDTEKKSEQLEPTVQAHPETPQFLKVPFSKKERPLLTPTETAILSLTFNNKSRDKSAPSSYTKFVSRGTNTYMPWSQNKSTSTGLNHQTRLNVRPTSPDFMYCARTKSVPSLPLKIWETSKPQNIVTKPPHVGEASPGPDCKAKDSFGPSSHPVHAFIPGRNESGEILPNDPTKDLYHWSESSKGQGQSDSPSMSQSSVPEASNVSKPSSGTVLPLLKESTPSPGLLEKSSLIAGDHRSRDPFGLDEQVKASICHHTWLPPSIFSEQPPECIIGLDFQALIELDSQSTHELKPDSQDLSQSNPNDQAISPPIKDNQSESAPDEKVQGMPAHQVSPPPGTDKLVNIETKSTITQEGEDQVTQNSPVVNPKESVTSSGDQKDPSSGNGHHRVKVGLNSDSQDEAKSGPQKQNQSIQDRDIPWRLKYLKPYTIKGGQVSAQTVNAIVNSIPEQKIKSDMCKQVLMRRMKESPPHRPGQRIPLSYTVCLECASWIPNGCPHIEGMNRLSETELLVIPMPLPGSEEMGVKFILKVPHKKKPFSFFSMLFPEYEVYWPPQQSSDLPPPSDNETYGPKVIQLQPSSLPPGTEPCERPQVTLFDLIIGKDRRSSEKKQPRGQLPPVEELSIGSEDDGRELLRVL